jgi:hypothetical protein
MIGMWKEDSQTQFQGFDQLCTGSESIDVAKFVDALGHANCCSTDNCDACQSAAACVSQFGCADQAATAVHSVRATSEGRQYVMDERNYPGAESACRAMGGELASYDEEIHDWARRIGREVWIKQETGGGFDTATDDQGFCQDCSGEGEEKPYPCDMPPPPPPPPSADSSFTCVSCIISCQAAYQDDPSLGSGVYLVCGQGDVPQYNAFCEMETAGGGWTMVMAYEGREVILHVPARSFLRDFLCRTEQGSEE